MNTRFYRAGLFIAGVAAALGFGAHHAQARELVSLPQGYEPKAAPLYAGL